MVARMTVYERRDFEGKIDRLRSMINHVPRWYTGEVDGHPVMVEDNGEVVMTFAGPWGPSVAFLFAHLTQDVGLHLLGLLEETPGTSAQDHAVKFLAALRMEDVELRRR